MNANLVFEAINGAWTIALAYVVIFILLYLYTAMRAQGTRAFVKTLFFNRPVPEQLAIAILISDLGNAVVRGSTWFWRSQGSDLGRIDGVLFLVIITGAAVGTAGILCKLRVISILRFGHWPWVSCAAAIIMAAVWEMLN